MDHRIRAFAISTAVIACGAVPLGLILASPVMNAEPHWHDGDHHGRWSDGSPMSAEDCDNLFGGEGWE